MSTPVTQVTAAEILAGLRREFPKVGFIADPAAGRWFAITGGQVLSARNGLDLRALLLAVRRDPTSCLKALSRP